MKTEEYLVSRGYKRLNTSIPTVTAMYRTEPGRVFCLIIINTSLYEYDYAQQSHIRDQFRASFAEKGYSDIRIHTLIVAGRKGSGRDIMINDPDCWILDGVSGRVILFENSASDFDGIRMGLEEAWLKDFAEGVARAYERVMQKRQDKASHTSALSILGYMFRNNECTVGLVLINILVYAALSIFGSTTDAAYMARHGAMYSAYLVTNGEFYRLLTCMFMHFGFVHLATNMLALLLLGRQVEEILGKTRYLILYMISGIFAGFVSFVTSYISNSGAVSAGASGAIFGLIGALFAIVIKNKGKYRELTVPRIAFLVAYSLYSGFTARGIDNAAHIGGLIMGLIVGVIVYRPGKAAGERHFNKAV